MLHVRGHGYNSGHSADGPEHAALTDVNDDVQCSGNGAADVPVT